MQKLATKDRQNKHGAISNAHREYTNDVRTQRNSYHIANSIQDTTDALITLREQLTADREHIANLITANTNLMEHFNEANQKITMHQMQQITVRLNCQHNNSCNNNRNRHRNRYQNCHYCWTCGLNNTHESLACRKPRDGHQNDMTRENTMGGSR